MIILLNLFLPLLAEILAASRTKGILRSYFLAQIGCTIACWFGWQTWGVESDSYRLIYSIATACILIPSFLLAWEAGARIWVFSLSALLFSLPVGLWCYVNTVKHGVDFWIVALEASLLAFLGISAGFRVHLTLDRNLLILSVLWILMAGYDCAWLGTTAVGGTMDFILPMYFVTAASLAVALLPSRQYKSESPLPLAPGR